MLPLGELVASKVADPGPVVAFGRLTDAELRVRTLSGRWCFRARTRLADTVKALDVSTVVPGVGPVHSVTMVLRNVLTG